VSESVSESGSSVSEFRVGVPASPVSEFRCRSSVSEFRCRSSGVELVAVAKAGRTWTLTVAAPTDLSLALQDAR
jgi:hypothetical protein